jgi:hypothetical protein
MTETRPDVHAEAAAAATATLVQMTADFHAAPEQQLARARERLAQMGHDPVRNVAAAAEVDRLQANIRTVEMQAAPMAGESQLDRALRLVDLEAAAGRPIGTGGEWTSGDDMATRDMMIAVADFRAQGLNDLQIREAINGAEERAEIIAEAKERLAQREADPEWTQKLSAHDRATKLEHTLLGIVVNARARV